MTGDTRSFILKVVGALAAIGIGVAGLTTPPLLAIPPVMSGVFITGGLLACGVNIGATVAAGVEASVLRRARRDARPVPRR